MAIFSALKGALYGLNRLRFAPDLVGLLGVWGPEGQPKLDYLCLGFGYSLNRANSLKLALPIL